MRHVKFLWLFLLIFIVLVKSQDEIDILLQQWHQKKWELRTDPNSALSRDKRMRERRLPKLERSMTCRDGKCFFPGVKISMEEGGVILFCGDCADPHIEGSTVEAWEAFYHPPSYHVHGDLVLGIPNDGSEPFLNSRHVRGNIALVIRGGVGVALKVRHAEDAGALAVIIIDDGQCSENFECGLMGSRSKGGFGAKDDYSYWSRISIPAVMISQSSGSRLKGMMRLSNVTVPDLGLQEMDEFSCQIPGQAG